MRILAIEPGPDFSVADVHRGWVKALSNLGCGVQNVNFSDRLNFYGQATFRKGRAYKKALTNEQAIGIANQTIRADAFDWWPDVVLVTSCFFISPFTLKMFRERRMKIVLLLTESPYEDQRQLDQAPWADVVILNDPTNLDAFRAVNPNTHYLPHAYDPDVHHPGPLVPEYASEFCFVGTGFPSRVSFFEQVDFTGIDAMLAGNWLAARKSPIRRFVPHPLDECVDNRQTAELYRSTKASVNFYRREAEDGALPGWAMGPREVELASCGTFFLTEERGENREVLPMVPTFDGPQDFEQQLRWFLANEGAREDIALKAREAIADRTFEGNAGRLLHLL